MNKECNRELAQNAIRWCSNILVEVLSNYGEDMEPRQRSELKKAVCALGDYQAAHAPVDHETEMLWRKTGNNLKPISGRNYTNELRRNTP